jgi:NAD(P)-dependent dehydrogenase (short-subunit alcohol dehydrogenase family)
MKPVIDLLSYRPPSDLLAGRVILVTGSTRGIGRACAIAFAQHGATVVLHGRHPKTLESAYDEITSRGYPEPAAIPLDLEKAGVREFDHLAYAIESQLGRLDGIVHNAAHLEKLSALEHQSIEEWKRTLAVNLVAPFALTQCCARLLRSAPDASVIFASETHAARPAAFWGAYAVSKAGVESLAKIQADEWSRFSHLRANVIVPGPVASPAHGKTHPGEAASELPPAASLMPVYLYLIGPDSRGVTGRIFNAQG